MRITVAAAVAGLALIGLSVAAESQAAVKRFTNIPAQALGSALETLEKDRGMEVIFVAEDIRDIRTSGAIGEFTPEETLVRLLTGTGLTYRLVDERTITILPDRTLRPQVSPQTSTDGGYPGARPGSGVGQFPGIASEANARQATFAGGRPEDGDSPWLQRRHARTAEESGAGQAGGSAADPQTTGLEEVVVTARKRAERLLEVPMSIAVVSQLEIDHRGLVHSKDYLRGIPGVSQVDDSFGQSISIRGIESSPSYQNFYSGTTVATYFGETPTTSSAGLSGGTNVDLKLVDVERVEVLRGPQGTAFGNSSMGGAVRTIPVAPQLGVLEGSATANYSVTSGSGGDNYLGQFVANVPLGGDRFALRAAAYTMEDSGYYRNRAGSDADFLAAIAPYGSEAYASDRDDVGAHRVDGWRVSALLQANDRLRFTVGYATQDSETDGFPLANNGKFEQVMLEVAPENVHRGAKHGFADNYIDIANAVMEYDAGWGSLVATYSHIEGGSTSASNYTLNYPILTWPLSQRAISEQQGDLGEVRFTSQHDGTWNYLVGLYAERLVDDYSDLYYWTGDPATNFFAPGELYSGGILEDHRVLEQKAAFGEVSWRFAPQFTLTGGIRHYDYDRTAHYVTDGLFGVGDSNTSTDASGNSLRGNLKYEPTESAMLYLGWSEGFRLGRPQPGLPPALCDVDGDGIIDGTNVTLESTAYVNSDEVDNYEIGGKFLLADKRLTIDAAVFRMDWKGMPVSVGLASGSCPLGYTANAGTARSEGVEFQSRFLVSDQFSIGFGGSWVDAKFTEDVPAAGIVADKRLPGSPDVNANLALEYAFTIGGYDAFVRADATYIGELYGTIVNQTEAVRAGEYVELDASARITIKKLALDLFVRNLTNEDEFTFRGTQEFIGDFYGYRMRPRTVGVQLSYTF